MENILECRQLKKAYKGTIGLDNFNLSLQKGKIVGLLGPNGSGKTTLIKSICGLLSLDSGEILVNGNKVGTESKKIVSYLADKIVYDLSMKVEDLIQLYCDFFADFNKERAREMLNNLKIDTKKKIKTLSKGNQEKVSLIMVMSRDASVFLLDEPIAGVDPATRDYILNTIISNYNENATVVISTHLISDVENILDEAIFIKEGKIILHDTVDNIRDKEGMSVDQLFREVFKC